MEDETAWEGLKCSDRFRQAQHTWQAAGTGEDCPGRTVYLLSLGEDTATI